jgi:hypothetical protein
MALVLTSAVLAGEYSSTWGEYLANQKSATGMVSAIITMADQVDLGALRVHLYAEKADRRAWHEAVVSALQEKATDSQADIIARLEELKARGEVEKYGTLWIANIVIIKASPAVLDELVWRQDVMRISPDYQIESIEPASRGDDEPIIAGHELGLERIRANECWAIGITGEGRLVSHLDTGVDGDHPALVDRWRGFDSRYAGHPEWAWFDPVTNTDFPFDSGTHGTHTMGTICGLGQPSDTIGVAFGAQWISAAVIDRVSIPRTVQDALAAFEWSADPDGDPVTVWDVPDVSCNAWGLATGHGYPPCDETFWIAIDGCEAAGVVVVFGAGGDGPGPSSIRRPADRAIDDVTNFAVGAVDGTYPEMPIASFSSRGPSNCTLDGSDANKPEVVAPGVNIRSSVPGGGYQGGWSGTSMAVAHVAGVVALMRQMNPNLTSEQVKAILLETAMDRGSPGDDNAYGMGVVDAYEAVMASIARMEWAILGGIITDVASGLPIEGARVSVVDRPWSAYSRPDGSYRLFVPDDSTRTIRIEHPPNYLPEFDTVAFVLDDTVFRDYSLIPKVPVTLRASFGNPEDASYRHFYLKGSWDSDGLYDSCWSAPLIVVSDDGMAPDDTAGDGIFTGEIFLARDSVHTYEWAIYTEDYGAEAARLQDGPGFQIPDFNPPDVPILSVNPSGSDHNWGISVYGNDGALQFDLVRGLYGTPANWGAAESLFEGNTYTFIFRPMHSDVANYGDGGVGGEAIVYNCTFTAIYDFIFDDDDDNYMIHGGGAGWYLAATSGLEGHVWLSWFPLGRSIKQEVHDLDGSPSHMPNQSGLAGTRQPLISDIEVDGFRLYRSTSPGPFYGGEQNLVNNPDIPGGLILESYYDDWVRWNGSDSIENGVLYYYQLSAVYGIGGGQYIEVGPSNEASATPQNYPPSPPFNLTGIADNRNVFLNWSFVNVVGDWDHYAVYKRLLSDSLWTQSGTTTDTIFVLVIPQGEDGYYAFAVTAIDDGSPPLESEYSNMVILQIGNPPVCMYLVGDINGSGQANGVDVSYGVNYFKGSGDPPPVICPDCPDPGQELYAAGDVNANCIFNGVDITYFVNYLKGTGPGLGFCHSCPPVLLNPASPADIPSDVPTLGTEGLSKFQN